MLILISSFTELYILPHCIVREDSIVLKHHTDISLGRVKVIDTLIAKVEISAFYAVEAGDHAEQSCFPAPRRAQKCEEFTRIDIDAQIRNNHIVSVLFYRVTDSDIHAHTQSLLCKEFL